ncbi:MAG: restriction endonuclease subunit S [Gammaproteobacteria bacterium]|jgi:restriction endonuclease S subunit
MSEQLLEKWQETTLDKVSMIIGGGTPKSTIKEYWNGDIPWISIADFNNENRWICKTEKTITEAGLNNSDCSVDPSDMDDYIQFIKNATTKRCKKMLKILKGMDSNKTNNFEISKC